MQYRLRKAALQQSLTKLNERRWLFANLPLDPTHAEWLRRRAWVRTIHGTTRIEGNTLSDIDVDALLANAGSGRVSDREAREIIGTREALQLVDELVGRTEVPLDEQVIREIHRRVLWGQSPLLTPGEYRRGENRVIDADGATIFTAPPSGDVPPLMGQLGDWLTGRSGNLDAPTAAALAHLEFVAIHPFNDGNGRTARAISRLILGRHDFAFDRLVSLDAQLDLDRVAYFEAIRAAVGRSYVPGYDATTFVQYFIDSLTQAADHVLDRIRGLGLVTTAVRGAVSAGTLPAPLIDGLAYAWINRHLRAGDYIRTTGRSAQNTTRDLQHAVDDGWLVAVGERRARVYLLGPKLIDIPATGEIRPLADNRPFD